MMEQSIQSLLNRSLKGLTLSMTTTFIFNTMLAQIVPNSVFPRIWRDVNWLLGFHIYDMGWYFSLPESPWNLTMASLLARLPHPS